ncbi:hypothetical protein C8R45DRAFT_929307 [Mycena sanguinolenta]|nr:hypothetical protein C8R45DRAFT_929307 [Mycena sanguinolenta]
MKGVMSRVETLKNVYSVFRPTPFSIGFAELSTPSSKHKSHVPSRDVIIVACTVAGGFVLALIARVVESIRERNTVSARPPSPEHRTVMVISAGRIGPGFTQGPNSLRF